MKKLLRDRFLPSNYKQYSVSLKDSFTLADTVRLAKKVERELEQNNKGPSLWMFLESSHTSYDYDKTKKPQFIFEKEYGFVKSTEEATKKTSAIMWIIEPEASETEIAKEKVFLVVDNETVTTKKEDFATINIHPKVQTLIMHGIPNDDDMLMKTDIMHDIPKDVVSDVTHIDIAPMEEKDIIASEAIDNIYDLLGGGLITKEMECERNSSLETLSGNNFDNIEMKLLAQEHKRQQGKDLDEFFKSSIDSHTVTHINIIWERFIQKFDSEEF